MPDYVRRLKDQIFELKDTLQLISSAVLDQRHGLEQLTFELRTSLESSGNKTQVHQLPSILRTILDDQTVGAFLVGQDGRYLLSNAVAESIFGSSWIRNLDNLSSSDCGIFLSNKETHCLQETLPWQQCARGADTQEVLLFLRKKEVRTGLWIRSVSMPLRDEDNSSNGAVAFFLDVTEQIQIEEQIKQLLSTLEQQLASIEMAHLLLSQLTSKLSHVKSSEDSPTLPRPVLAKVMPKATEPTGIAVEFEQKKLNAGSSDTGEFETIAIVSAPGTTNGAWSRASADGALESGGDTSIAAASIQKKSIGAYMGEAGRMGETQLTTNAPGLASVDSVLAARAETSSPIAEIQASTAIVAEAKILDEIKAAPTSVETRGSNGSNGSKNSTNPDGLGVPSKAAASHPSNGSHSPNAAHVSHVSHASHDSNDSNDSTKSNQPVGSIKTISSAADGPIKEDTANGALNKAPGATVPAAATAIETLKRSVLPPAVPFDKKEISSTQSSPLTAPRGVINSKRVSTNNVLIVDDIPVNQKLLRLQLKRLGFNIDTAANGKEAVNAVVKTDYDFVFMDLDMPIMDGPTAAATIRKLEANTDKHVPIIAMTSYDRDVDRQACLQSGMDDYLVKGATQKQLADVVVKFSQRIAAVGAEAAQKGLKVEEVITAVDLNSLRKSLGKEELEEVFRLFNSSISTFVECMRLAIDERNSDAVSHFAHCIKGPAAAMGLTGITTIISEMIHASEAEDWLHVGYLYLNLRTNFSHVLMKLKTLCEAAPVGSNGLVSEVR